MVAHRFSSKNSAVALKGRVENYWDARSETFARQRETELAGAAHALWAEELRAQLDGQRGLRILDVGCGCGFFAMILAEAGQEVCGIDLSAQMVAHGRALLQEKNLSATLLQMDAEALVFKDSAFDVVISRNLTWTLAHPALAYAEWLRVLKPGGLLLNYDAEHAKHHRRMGLARDGAHKMLSTEQMAECMALYDLLPASRLSRPAWDAALLARAGCTVDVDASCGDRLFDGYPIFRLKARKGQG